MNICFMGTPDFAAKSLYEIHKNHNVVSVITQPDKPSGRGKKLTQPKVKEVAISLGIEVFQPISIKNEQVISYIKSLNIDIIVVIAFGKLLPKEIINIPKYGCINVHASLLPKYRGAAPIQRSIINGDTTTGITVMRMDIGLDTGDIILTKEVNINNKTSGQLFEEMSIVGAEVLAQALDCIQNGTATYTMQNNNEATYAPMLTKEDGKIIWEKTSKEIINLINGTNPWPGAYTTYNGNIIKIWQASNISYNTSIALPGTILCANTKDGIIIKTKDSALSLQIIQTQTGKRLASKEYVKGNKIEVNTVLYYTN